MQSLTKLAVSREAAQALAHKHLGSNTRILAYSELIEGYFNTAYYLELSHGQVCVLKVAPPPQVRVLRYERDIMKAEVLALRLVRQKTSIPVPSVLFFDESCELLPSPCFAMEFITGEPLHKLRPGLSSETQEQIDQNCGKYLHQMNAISGSQFGLFTPSAARFDTWREAFDHLLADVLLDGEQAGVELPRTHTALLDLARQHETSLDEVTRPALVHWDLWDGNIFVNPDTLQVSGLIDFERTLWGDPLMEVNFGAFGLNPAFIQAYGLELPLSPGEQTRRALYNLYLFLIMVIECHYRQYATNEQETWARGKLAETIFNLENLQ